jgi:hypothetical protein
MSSVFGRQVKYSTVPYSFREEGEGMLIEFVSTQGGIKAVILKSDGGFISAYLSEVSLCPEEKFSTK